MVSFVTDVFHTKVITYAALSSITNYLYDYVLTLNDEVGLYWTYGGSWVLRAVFLLSRYMPALGLLLGLLSLNPSGFILNDRTCRALFIADVICQSAMLICSTGMFLLSSWLQRNLKTFKRNIMSSNPHNFPTQLADKNSRQALHHLIPNLGFAFGTCSIVGQPPPYVGTIIAMAYMSALPCEIIIIGATWFHAYQTKELRLSTWDSVSWPILNRMYKDGAAFFVISLILRCSACLTHLLCNNNIKRVVDFMALSLNSVVSSRFFFSLRRSIVRSIIDNDVVEDGFGGTIQLQTNHDITLLRMRRRQQQTDWIIETVDKN
ncbi:hypothetical protein PIIN_05627 [Serendipita indica DSM 11827]|uniref:DUF6533 domain-containing protein n=1 Tax=Serendipita indica (strain DSM 11827) TaxID=1109443 RepID=G4TK49_SERID|nr:hypothetical protein PIIN_05627 [Serendipita indica DSM 11827]